MSGQAHRNAGTFFLHGSRDTGVLLVHGYSGAPAEMRMLGNFLQERVVILCWASAWPGIAQR